MEEVGVDNQPKWAAKVALACFLALVGGVLLGSLAVGLVLSSMGAIRPENLPFPIALISLPVNETIFLAITLLFARYKGASLKELGLRKISIKTLLTVSIGAIPLLLLGIGVSFSEEIIFGPNPWAQQVEALVMPRNNLQLVVMVAYSLILVGPCEELAIRGFVQKGLENSFGKRWGLLTSSALFGLLHGLNTPYAVMPVLAVGLVIGYVWQRTDGNTTAATLMHGVYDAIALTLAYSLSS
ncbi:MAG: CPBP family intramembrane metalloprotease [Candidatus Bathyarchaeota archaeon]|nr:MAG: CPBP family intramembrane metalloprotease [Candidatus Bathyarchaeota archaeon]